MTAPAKCPMCGTKLQPDWESCPNCPMSFLEPPPEVSVLARDNFRNIGVPILFFGALIGVMWQTGQYLWNTAQNESRAAGALLQNPGGVPSPAKGGGVVPTDSAGIQALVDEQRRRHEAQSSAPPVAPRATQPPVQNAAEDDPGIVSVMTAKTAKPKVVLEWKLRGTVYNLLTLKPVPGVSVIFTDNETNSRAQVLTDTDGRYRTVLPALSERGYSVSLSKSGYHKAYLDPAVEGVADMPLERRIGIAHELSTLLADPSPVQPTSDQPFESVFYIAPR